MFSKGLYQFVLWLLILLVLMAALIRYMSGVFNTVEQVNVESAAQHFSQSVQQIRSAWLLNRGQTTFKLSTAKLNSLPPEPEEELTFWMNKEGWPRDIVENDMLHRLQDNASCQRLWRYLQPFKLQPLQTMAQFSLDGTMLQYCSYEFKERLWLNYHLNTGKVIISKANY